MVKRKILFSPIFIIGQGRSGTTALQNCIGIHPLVIGYHTEAPLIQHIGEVLHIYYYNEYNEYYQKSNAVSEKELLKKLADINLKYSIGEKLALKKYIKDILRAFIKENKIFITKRFYVTKAVGTDKNSFLGLRKLYPKGKFIYITRNGFDQINSAMNHQMFQGKNFSFYCDEYDRYVKHFQYLLHTDDVLWVKHENLIDNPEDVLNEIFNYVDIKKSIRPLTYLKTTLLHSLSDPKTKKTNVKQEFKDREPVYLKWTEEQRKIFKEKCAYAMKELGYEIPY